MLLRIALPLVLVSALGACASDQAAPEPEHHHHHRDGGSPPPPQAAGAPDHRGGLFISPLGQPFRAGPGEPYPSSAWFQAANTAHDGRLTRSQFRADAETFFRSLDLNHDGVIDASEINAYEHAVPEIIEGFHPAQGGAPGGGQGAGGRGGGHHGGRHGGGGGGYGGGGAGRGGGSHAQFQPADTRPQGAAWFSLLNIPEPVASSDRNLDGKVTLEEFLQTADARFDELDADHAGYLSFDKLPKTPVQGRRASQATS
ncbi:MAG TPA: EF-hand domain-containing protein [Caulobacteraceae bacterium]|jgi:hypothetical protein|nr:EF-hand domain-containing protein [Caulobacteraceae bacterium]